MAVPIRETYLTSKDAITIYEDIKRRVDNNLLVNNQVLPYYPEYHLAVNNTTILPILSELLATKSWGILQQLEPVVGATEQFVLTQGANISSPFGGNYTTQLQSLYDLVNLYEECIKIFSNKITPIKLGQRYAFQTKYRFAFDAFPSEFDSIIGELCNQYSDANLNCTNQGAYYQIV